MDIEELKFLANAALIGKETDAGAWKQYFDAVRPTSVLELIAEVERLQSLNVEHIMLDVVPDLDGMPHEVYAKPRDAVERKLSDMWLRIEYLEMDLAALRNAIDLPADDTALRAELSALQARTDSVLETVFKVCEFLGIDYEAARSAPGKPSDVIISAITKKIAASQEEMRERCAAACDAQASGIASSPKVQTDCSESAVRESACRIRALEVKP